MLVSLTVLSQSFVSVSTSTQKASRARYSVLDHERLFISPLVVSSSMNFFSHFEPGRTDN